MVTVIHVTLAEATAALATTAIAAAKAADPIIKSKSDTYTNLQTQLTDRPYPKPGFVSSAVFHTDTDDDYDDAGDERRDEDSKSSSRKPAAVKVKEEDLEVEEGKTCCAVNRSSCTDHMHDPSSVSISNDDNDEGEKKRDLESRHSNSNKQVKKRQKIVDAFTFDLSDVPPQLPISKHADKVKEGASKYQGVTFHKASCKWRTQITIDGKSHQEEAAAVYARAVFKYKGTEAIDRAKNRNSSGWDRKRISSTIDLSDVPYQLPITKPAYLIKEGASKYAGVCFDKERKMWKAQITIEGKKLGIGRFENEEEAAVQYARAVFKYKGQDALDKARVYLQEKRQSLEIDLSDVPQQRPILRHADRIKDGASKYAGVFFLNRGRKRWEAKIWIDGKTQNIGTYENEEEAAADYARAVFKYRGHSYLMRK